MIQGYFLFKRLNADAVLLKGGFVCVPIAMAAHAHKVPYITHDSDALPGLSNRIAARWAKYHATAMPAQYYSYPKKSIRVVGVPTDSRFRGYSKAEQAILREKFKVPADAQIILATGGSNGARRLNDAIINVLPELLSKNPKLHILHQIGAGNEDQTASLPSKLSSHATFVDFTPELFHMSAIADVVIARAGASAIADFAQQGKACVIVPNPFLTGGHQLKNAQVYADARAAIVLQENDLAADARLLSSAVQELLDNPKMREELAKNLHTLVPQKSAAVSLAELLGEVAA